MGLLYGMEDKVQTKTKPEQSVNARNTTVEQLDKPALSLVETEKAYGTLFPLPLCASTSVLWF